MLENEKRIIRTVVKIFPDMSQMEKEKFLSFAQGMAFAKSRQKEQEVENNSKERR